jgi:hypothetical protein
MDPFASVDGELEGSNIPTGVIQEGVPSMPRLGVIGERRHTAGRHVEGRATVARGRVGGSSLRPARDARERSRGGKGYTPVGRDGHIPGSR